MNALYTKGLEGILDGSIHWLTDNIKVLLVDTASYTAKLTTDKYLSDIPSAARVASSTVLTNRTVINGIADADDVSFAAVSGPSIEALVLYADTGSASTSRLLHYVDTGSGLPISTDGGSVNILWPNSGDYIFKLGG